MASTGVESPSADLIELAVEAFFYGFAMVFDLQEVKRFTEASRLRR